MSRLLRIGELANLAGVSTRTVDFYTGLGLIEPAERTAGNFRLYSADCIDRIASGTRCGRCVTAVDPGRWSSTLRLEARAAR